MDTSIPDGWLGGASPGLQAGERVKPYLDRARQLEGIDLNLATVDEIRELLVEERMKRLD